MTSVRDFVTPSRSISLLRAETSGQNPSSGLSTLKYFIRSIVLCQELTVTNTSFSNPTGCITLYTRPDNSAYNYTLGSDYTPLAALARADQTNFVDLMTVNGKNSLGGTFNLNRTHVGIYNWGYISFYPAVKFTSAVTINNGVTTQTYNTHDGTTSHLGSGVHMTQSSSNFTSGSAQEASVLLSSDGTWFRLHTPLTITHSDIDSMNSFLLDLFLNTEGMVKGYSNGITMTGNYVLRDASTELASNKMTVAPLTFSPIARSYNQTITKESYLFNFSAVAGVTDRFNLRMDLLYATEDATKAVCGVEVKVLFRIVGQETSLYTVTEVAEIPRISEITRNADGTLNFLFADGSTFLLNFSRLTTVNSSGNATVHCSTNWNPSSCSGNLTVPYTLTALSTL